jgi:DUF1680 family protein
MLANGESQDPVNLRTARSLYRYLFIPLRIEAACYFLSSEDTKNTPQAKEYRQAMDTMVDLIERAQQEDGYLNIYFTVVDPEGRFKNLRDMHEMC